MSKEFLVWTHEGNNRYYFDFDDNAHIILLACHCYAPEDPKFRVRLYDGFTLLFEEDEPKAQNLQEAKEEALLLCQNFVKEQVAKYKKLRNLVCGNREKK